MPRSCFYLLKNEMICANKEDLRMGIKKKIIARKAGKVNYEVPRHNKLQH